MPSFATPATELFFAQLQGSRYDFEELVYPLSIQNDFETPHFMIFFINDTDPTVYNSSLTSPVTTGLPISPSSVSRGTTRTPKAIVMYIPETLVFSYSANWENEGFDFFGSLQGFASRKAGMAAASVGAEAMIGGAGDVDYSALLESGQREFQQRYGTLGDDLRRGLEETAAGGFRSFAALSSAPRVQRAVRRTKNPRLEVLFRNINFRSFNFQFTLTPNSQDEAAAIKNIIRTFKFYSHPGMTDETEGRYFSDYPAEFEIKFYRNGSLNESIPQIAPSVLTNISTNYAGEGMFTSHTDGTPTKVIMSLQFTETKIITRTDIEEGY